MSLFSWFLILCLIGCAASIWVSVARPDLKKSSNKSDDKPEDTPDNDKLRVSVILEAPHTVWPEVSYVRPMRRIRAGSIE